MNPSFSMHDMKTMQETSGCLLEAAFTTATKSDAYLPCGEWESKVRKAQRLALHHRSAESENEFDTSTAAENSSSSGSGDGDEDIDDGRDGNRISIPYIYGNYAQHLKAYLKYFRRDQFLIFNSNTAFTSPKKVMDAISIFLQVKPISSWSGPFPHEDHTGNIAHLNCTKKYAPELDCSLRDLMASYYRQLNGELYKLLNETKGAAHPAEPSFEPFDDPMITVPCVPDARKNLNILLEQRKRDKKAPNCH
jgi:hypothetical protein